MEGLIKFLWDSVFIQRRRLGGGLMCGRYWVSSGLLREKWPKVSLILRLCFSTISLIYKVALALAFRIELESFRLVRGKVPKTHESYVTIRLAILRFS